MQKMNTICKNKVLTSSVLKNEFYNSRKKDRLSYQINKVDMA